MGAAFFQRLTATLPATRQATHIGTQLVGGLDHAIPFGHRLRELGLQKLSLFFPGILRFRVLLLQLQGLRTPTHLARTCQDLALLQQALHLLLQKQGATAPGGTIQLHFLQPGIQSSGDLGHLRLWPFSLLRLLRLLLRVDLGTTAGTQIPNKAYRPTLGWFFNTCQWR